MTTQVIEPRVELTFINSSMTTLYQTDIVLNQLYMVYHYTYRNMHPSTLIREISIFCRY